MTRRDERFVAAVYAHYDRLGRHHLPWRKRCTPYQILVSEVMLQQTQVDRVVPAYRRFLKRFPTLRALSSAPLSAVLQQWQGLGYNRRAKLLVALAREVVDKHRGRLPTTYEALRALPGVGPYTASALCVFAYNQPRPLIETNVRTVYLHHFFPKAEKVSDAELWPHIIRTFDRTEPRRWCAALMDYGAHLKRTVGNVSRASAHYKRAPRFKGSTRELRGAIIRALSTTTSLSARDFNRLLPSTTQAMVHEQLRRLEEEGFLERRSTRYRLASGYR